MTLGECPIGDLVEKCHTWNPKASDAGSFDYIDLSSIDKDTKCIASIERHECSEAPSRARQIVEAGDVLVATVRPNLNGVALVNGTQQGMTASTGYCVLRPNEDKLDARFLFHWVKTGVFVQRMVDVATGANYPAVSDAKVKASTIPLPPLAEQKRIAGILDAADALRAKRRESLAQLDALIQSAFIDMFGDPFGDGVVEEHVPFSELTERITYGFTSPMSHLESGIPILTAKNILDGVLDLDKVHYAGQDEFDALTAKSKPNPGDVLITKDGSIGRCAVVPEIGQVCINQSVALVIPDRSVVISEYVSAYVRCSPVQQRIQRMGKGNALKHLQITELANFPTIIPPLDLQRHFADIVKSIGQQKASQRAHLDELDALFASLQSRAFKGDL
jgi:type I restriction enzyme, S subunit